MGHWGGSGSHRIDHQTLLQIGVASAMIVLITKGLESREDDDH